MGASLVQGAVAQLVHGEVPITIHVPSSPGGHTIMLDVVIPSPPPPSSLLLGCKLHRLRIYFVVALLFMTEYML